MLSSLRYLEQQISSFTVGRPGFSVASGKRTKEGLLLILEASPDDAAAVSGVGGANKLNPQKLLDLVNFVH